MANRPSCKATVLKRTWYYGVEVIGQTGVQKDIQSHHDEATAERYSGTGPQVVEIHSLALQIQHQSLHTRKKVFRNTYQIFSSEIDTVTKTLRKIFYYYMLFINILFINTSKKVFFYLVHRKCDTGRTQEGNYPERDRTGIVDEHLDEVHQTQRRDRKVTQNTGGLKETILLIIKTALFKKLELLGTTTLSGENCALRINLRATCQRTA